MYLIVGLGNPGPEYAVTRHNIGFMLVDRIAEAYSIKKSFKNTNNRIAPVDVVFADCLDPADFCHLFLLHDIGRIIDKGDPAGIAGGCQQQGP